MLIAHTHSYQGLANYAWVMAGGTRRWKYRNLSRELCCHRHWWILRFLCRKCKCHPSGQQQQPECPSVACDGAATYSQGEVVYNDDDGRYYVATAATTALTAGQSVFQNLVTSYHYGGLPTVSNHDAFDASKDYVTNDIVSFDGNLYIATTGVGKGNQDPVQNGN